MVVYRYTPILRWKRGEKAALKSVAAPLAANISPLIIVTDETFKDQPEKIDQEAVPASFLFADEIHKNWGARAFYLDASGVKPKGVHSLIKTAELCRDLGANLTPATSLGAPAPYEAAVMQVAQADKRGVALRVTLREFSSAENWVPSWPHSLKETDLIVDLGEKVTTIVDLGSTLDATFRALHKGKDWRSVTVAGTSMPENFGGMKPGLQTIERTELALWHQLLQSSLPYRIDYGDYATVPIIPAPSAIAWGYPINVRYTLPTKFLICRGVPPTGENGVDLDEQLVGHATSIKKYRQRDRIDCWSDKIIDKIADEEEPPGNLEKWVRIAVNRHLELVRSKMP
jgi:hypothetical protein